MRQDLAVATKLARSTGGGGAIRVHILSVKSRKDGGNDEKRQDNSKNMERVSTQEADS